MSNPADTPISPRQTHAVRFRLVAAASPARRCPWRKRSRTCEGKILCGRVFGRAATWRGVRSQRCAMQCSGGSLQNRKRQFQENFSQRPSSHVPTLVYKAIPYQPCRRQFRPPLAHWCWRRCSSACFWYSSPDVDAWPEAGVRLVFPDDLPDHGGRVAASEEQVAHEVDQGIAF